MLKQRLNSGEKAEKVTRDVAFAIAVLRPPPFDLVLVALPGDGKLVAGLEGQFVVVASLVVIDSVNVAAVNNPEFLLLKGNLKNKH